ncbi:serine/threonine-protein kinase [Streptomyces sp. ODS05-4]|uniref:serine/threonine-protein kinase n=1 Tax=Streptomyces sp. ODS05-4 TaxID=2944939 RepID=UPI00210B7B31|nr:serine/threonine-protein kinase [Streptomyces sp. ODS05-4]
MEGLRAGDPRTVGGYRVLGRLGEGGMGQVYLARNAGGRAVALKRVHTEMATVPGFRERFRREVEVVRRIGGRGTVPVLDAGVDDRHPWYAAEYVPGPSLQQAVDSFGPLPRRALWRLAAGLARTLEHVHRHDLVHRDLKPSNVLLSTAGPRLIDFGVVHAALDTALTVSGARIGTPVYMSPEQAYGERITGASDVYSFGLTLAFAASGRVPHRGALAGQLPDADPALTTLVEHCLDPEPGRRPDAAHLVVRCEAYDEGADAWLPAEVVSLIARRSEELLNLEAGPDRDPGSAAPPPRTAPDPRAHGAGPAFHDAATRGPGGPGPSAPPPPRTAPRPPRTAPPPPRSGPPPFRTPPRPRTSPAGVVSWVRRGVLAWPAVGLLWLAPLAVASLLVAVTLPSALGWLRVLLSAGLAGWALVLTFALRGDDRRWFRGVQTFWGLFAVLVWEGFLSTGDYELDVFVSHPAMPLSVFESFTVLVLGLVRPFLLLAVVATVYVVPTLVGRWLRLRREGV